MVRDLRRTVCNMLYAAYKCTLSLVTPPACRFQPTCSEYARVAVIRFGFLRGGWLTLKRLLRCHPFHRRFGYDPVPQNEQDVKEGGQYERTEDCER